MMNPPLQWSAHILGHDSPVGLACGQLVSVKLRAKLSCASNRVYGLRLPVQVSYQWFDANDQPQTNAEVRRTTIPIIAFNQKFLVNAMLAAPKTPGAYRVQWEFALGENEVGLPPSASAALGNPIIVSAMPNAINNWRVESNVNAAEIAKTLDGDANTAWDSRIAQARGQWFRLNLSQPRLLDGIQFLSPGNGFPRGYALNVSADNETWTELARVPSNNVDEIRVAFAPQLVQYAQIDLEAPSQTSWKISEILAHPGIEWRANASHNAEAAFSAIDNRADTAWAIESPQEPGMWFQLDLGREESVDGVRLTAPGNAAANPFAFRIAAWIANESKWEVVYGLSQNFEAVDAHFEPVQTQFINIQLIEPHESLWAIRNVHVYREMKDWLSPTT